MIDDLIPYLLTTQENIPFLNLEGLDEVRVLRIDQRQNADFCRFLNEANQRAFGGPTSMGMPKWVMLDCAILASAMIGFMIPNDCLDDALRKRLAIPSTYQGAVPISEYSAAFTARPRSVSGFSLQTQIENRGLATRTKALALAILNANHQVGVTQFDSKAISTHCKFGALEIMIYQPIVHTYSENSFVYSVDLPERGRLIEMYKGLRNKVCREKNIFWFNPKDKTHQKKIKIHLEAQRRVKIVSPGYRLDEKGMQIAMVFD